MFVLSIVLTSLFSMSLVKVRGFYTEDEPRVTIFQKFGHYPVCHYHSPAKIKSSTCTTT